MPVFQPNTRTVQSYLAGIGASTALVGCALLAFFVLVGAVTFDAWPPGGNPFSGRDDGTSLNLGAPASEAPAPGNTPDLIELLGRKPPAAGTRVVAPGNAAPLRPQPGPGGPGGSESPRLEGSGPQSPPAAGIQPSRTTPVSSERNVVQQTLSNVGNAVESNTSTLGENLGGSTNPVGGLVGDLGKTVNDTLQRLAGSG